VGLAMDGSNAFKIDTIDIHTVENGSSRPVWLGSHTRPTAGWCVISQNQIY
jgi:hypothetical protein